MRDELKQFLVFCVNQQIFNLIAKNLYKINPYAINAVPIVDGAPDELHPFTAYNVIPGFLPR